MKGEDQDAEPWDCITVIRAVNMTSQVPEGGPNVPTRLSEEIIVNGENQLFVIM